MDKGHHKDEGNSTQDNRQGHSSWNQQSVCWSPIWNKLFFGTGTPRFGFFWPLPITEWRSLFQNLDPILEWFQIGDSFLESPIWNGNYSRTVSDWTIPVLKRGCSHALFWNGDPHFGMGIANGYVPILKQGSPFQNREYWQPCSEMGIMPLFWLLVVRDSKDRKKCSPRSETGSPHSVMGRRQKIFQIRESPD